MKLALAAIYTIWAGLVLAGWIISEPESAPQQAALAGQTLVLAFIPYAIVSVIQRSWDASQRVEGERNRTQQSYDDNL